MIKRLSAGFGSLSLLALFLVSFQSCAPTKTTLKDIFIPPPVTLDSNTPYYLHNVSQIKFWDRMSQANRATDFAWWDSTGKVHQMFDYYDKVVVLTFFGTWSASSTAQLAAIDTVLRSGDTNFLVLAASLKEGVFNGKAVLHVDTFVRAHDIQYQVLIGSRDFAFTYGGVDAVPTTFVITRKRRISATLDGYASSAMLIDAIKKAEAAQ
jgi:hypothetical protein